MLTLPNNTLVPNTKSSDKNIPPSKSLTSFVSEETSQQGVRRNSNSNRDKGKKTSCDINKASLKVYMYDLPPEFHSGSLNWKGRKRNQICPDEDKLDQIPRYPGGLNLQHSVEYWLTLDLLSSNVCLLYTSPSPRDS